MKKLKTQRRINMKFKLLTVIGLLITFNVNAEPVTNESIEKAFEGSTETTTVKTNSVFEGYVGFTDGVVTQGTAPLEVLPEVTDYTKKIVADAKQSIQMDEEESTAYKAGVTLGTIAVIGLGYMGIKHSAKKETEEMLKPLKDDNTKLLEGNDKLLKGNAKLQQELQDMKDLKREQYEAIKAQNANKDKAKELGLTEPNYTPFVP